MHTEQLGGRIGPLLDPATGAEVDARVFGTFSFETQGEPASAAAQLRANLVHAIRAVVQQKLQAGQVALPTLQSSLPYFTAEIVAQSGAATLGVQITNLALTVQVEAPSAGQPPAGPLPPTPMQATANAFAQAAQEQLDPRNYEYEARVDIGGFRIKASTDGGLDTDGLAEQAKDKAKSTLIWWGMGCAILAVVVIGLAGLGWWIYGQ